MMLETSKPSRLQGAWSRPPVAAAAFLLAFALILGWTSYEEYASTLAQEFRAIESQALLGDVQLAGALRSIDWVLESVIDDEQAAPRAPREVIQRRHLTFLKRFSEIQYLFIVDALGQVRSAEGLADPRGLTDLRAFNAAKRDYFTVHRDAKPEDYGRTQLSRPFRALSGRYTVTLSRAIRARDGSFQGVAVVSLALTYFDSILRQVLANEVVDAAALHNRFGDIIYRLPSPEKYVGKNIVDGDAFKAYLGSSQHLTRYVGVTLTDNVKRILVFSRVGETTLDVGVSAQFDSVMADWRRNVRLKILIFGVVAALTLVLAREMHRRGLARLARERDEQRFQAYFQRSMVGMATTSAEKGWIDVNPALCEMLGYSAAELRSMTWAEITHPDDLNGDVSQFGRLLAGDIDEYTLDKRFIRKGGSVVFTHLAVRAVRKPDGAVDYLVALVEDISERKRAESALESQKKYLQAIFDTEPECVKVVAANGFLENMNRAGLSMLEVGDLKEAQDVGLLEFVDPAYRQAFIDLHKSVCSGRSGTLEFPITGRRGTVRWLETHATPLRGESGDSIKLLGVTRDITEHKLFREKLEEQAHIDYLTGVNNRGYFMQLAELELTRAKRYNSKLSVFMLDIDLFKQVNDTHGHLVGDAVLVKLAEVCRLTLREVDVIGRFGGEEFVILLPETDIDVAEEVADRLRAAIAATRVAIEHGLPIQFSASIGVSSLRSSEENLDSLLDDADKALYEAKKSGRNKVCVAS